MIMRARDAWPVRLLVVLPGPRTLIMRRPFASAFNDPTLDALPRQALTTAASAPHARCPGVALVEGSGPQLRTETTHLLRTRLRAAALLMFAGLGAFFVWGLLNAPSRGRPSDAVFAFHLATVLVQGAASALLYRKCPITLQKLWFYEILIFGMPIGFLICIQYWSFMHWADRGMIPSPLAAWLMLMFTYALFIPNTWRRAAIIQALIAICPLTLILVVSSQSPIVAQRLQSYGGFFSEMLLMMVIGWSSSVYGTYLIGSLRRQAFEAKQLGQYRLQRLLGSGGMGEVYLAEHQLMKRPVAIKVIRPNKAQDPQAIARFEREVRATAKLSHWNTIEIFDYGSTDDGTFYYVMEYLPGLSLGELVERHGPLSPGRVIYLLQQTCDALGEAHAVGLIHRDLKPGNIFAAQRGGIYDVAKLLDFGLAKPILGGGPDINLTQEGFITGSPLFMSPEQATGDREPDARSDIYSLGAVAYYLLTGSPPFPGDKPIQVIMAHAQQEVVPPSRLRPEIPADLDAVVLRCLAKNPDNRYSDAESLARALEQCDAATHWSRAKAAQWWQEHESPRCQEEERLELVATA
jgi:eukaryotic-like serine/threonine-protein kinase